MTGLLRITTPIASGHRYNSTGAFDHNVVQRAGRMMDRVCVIAKASTVLSWCDSSVGAAAHIGPHRIVVVVELQALFGRCHSGDIRRRCNLA